MNRVIVIQILVAVISGAVLQEKTQKNLITKQWVESRIRKFYFLFFDDPDSLISRLKNDRSKAAQNIFYDCQTFCYDQPCTGCLCVGDSCKFCYHDQDQGQVCLECDGDSCTFCQADCECQTKQYESPLSTIYRKEQNCFQTQQWDSFTKQTGIDAGYQNGKIHVDSVQDVLFHYLIDSSKTTLTARKATNLLKDQQQNNYFSQTQYDVILNKKWNIDQNTTVSTQSLCPLYCQYFGGCEQCWCIDREHQTNAQDNYYCTLGVSIEGVQIQLECFSPQTCYGCTEDCICLQCSYGECFIQFDNYCSGQNFINFQTKVKQLRQEIDKNQRRKNSLMIYYEAYYCKRYFNSCQCTIEGCEDEENQYIQNQDTFQEVQIVTYCSAVQLQCDSCAQCQCLKCDLQGNCEYYEVC